MDDDDEYDGEEEEEVEITQEEKDAELLKFAKLGNLKEVKRCAKDGADPNAKAPDKWSPILWASCNGHMDVVQYLLDRGAGQEYAKRPVLIESKTESKSQDVKVKKQDPSKAINSPLHWAAFKGHLPIVWALLKANLSPYDIDPCGNTSLHLAATGGDAGVLKVLMSQGFDLTTRNWYGNTALDLADKPETRKLLFRAMEEKTCYASGKGFSAAVPRYYCTHSGHFYCEEETVSDFVIVQVGKSDTKPVRYCKESLRIIMGLEAKLTEVCKGKLDKSHLGSLRTAVSEGETNGCNVLLVHKARRTLARLVAECNLRDEMARVESLRPLKKRGDVKGLVVLIKKGRKEGVRDEDGMEEAEGVLAALEAEVTLSNVSSLFEGVECATMQHFKELQKLDIAMEEAEACGSHEGFVATVKAVQNKLHAEIDLGNALLEPGEETVVDEEGEPTEFCKYTMWDGTVYNTSEGGQRLKFWQSRYTFLTESIEKGNASEAYPSLLEKAVEQEVEWAERLKEEEVIEEERLAAEEAARIKAEKKAKKKKKKK